MAETPTVLDMERLQQDATSTPPQIAATVTLIVEILKAFGFRVPRPVARLLYEAIVEFAVTQTVRTGRFRLPGGWGVFHLRVIGEQAKPRRLPTGEYVTRQVRPVIRYEEGSATRDLVGTAPPSSYRRMTPRVSAIELGLKGMLPDEPVTRKGQRNVRSE